MNDNRSKKIALSSHCLLNQNSKVLGLARSPGIIPGLIDVLNSYNYGILQMPCPELRTAGLSRWGQVRNQYESAGFIKAFSLLADFVCDDVYEYKKAGYKIILIGVDGSPSCGVNVTEENEEWGGSILRLGTEKLKVYNTKRNGVFVELLKGIVKDKLNLDLPAIGIPVDLYEKEIDLNPLSHFLSKLEDECKGA